MGRVFVTSDLHLGHGKDFLYVPRGFKNIEEHDKFIINKWNEIITDEDEVYVLGDLMLGDNEAGLEKLRSLKGKLRVVRGNHDSAVRMELYSGLNNIIELCEGRYLHYKKYHFYLSHFPCICSNFDDERNLKSRTINLCGHSHAQDPFIDWNKYNSAIFHCEMDTHNCTPWELDEIIELMKEKNDALND